MQVVTLEISDDYYEKFLHVVDALPSEKVCVKKGDLKAELCRRIESIEENSDELIPYMEGMDAMIERVKAKHADR